MMTEYLLDTNDFGEPIKLTGASARAINILHLLLLEPGHNPLFLEMGVGLVNYRHIMDSELPALQKLVLNQIQTYLPEVLADTVELSIVNHKLKIRIICAKGKAVYEYDSNDPTVPVPLEVDS